MIELPFPSSKLSGHQGGRWRDKARVIATHRSWAFHATKAARLSVPEEGDIAIAFRFIPPNRRGDRTNYPNRLKPYIDGIAEALGVNDRRFLPSYEFAEPEKGGKVLVELSVCQPFFRAENAINGQSPQLEATNG